MDDLLITAALIVLAVPIWLIVLTVKHIGLRHRTEALAAEVNRLGAALQLAQAQQRSPVPVAQVAPTEAALPTAPPAAATPPVEPQPGLPEPTASPWQRAMAAHAAAKVDAAKDTAAPVDAAPDQNRPIVLTADRLAKLTAWLRDNWVYAVSALSLALAGVFFVQYGIEKGLLPPAVRVAFAMLFGAALIVVGEWMRRKHGDDTAANTAYLPSVFAGAGLVSIFAAIIAARQMYGLIGQEVAFVGLVLTAILAIVLGWFYGPLLAATGLIGAALAPMVVGGNSTNTDWLYGYFTLIAATGLAIDAIRRWAWVSVLALAIGYGCGFLILSAGAAPSGWTATLTILALLAASLPLLQAIPRHDGPATLEAAVLRNGIWPSFPTRLAAGAMLATTLGLLALDADTALDGMVVYAALTLLATAYLLWADKARGLIDLALLPMVAFLIRLALDAVSTAPLMWEFASQAIALRPAETAAPYTVTVLLGLATLISGAAALRARGTLYPSLFALAASLVAPLAAVVLELLWHPAQTLGDGPWALHIMALAALMTVFAITFAKTDPTKRSSAYATLSALSLIALSLFLLTTQSALTLALAALVLAAAWLDRRFKLPEMAWFIQLGCAVIGYRLTVDPGFAAALSAPLPQVWIAYAGTVATLTAAWLTLAPLPRPAAKAVLESAALGATALFANVLITRWLQGSDTTPNWIGSHWGATLNALPWLILMLTQLYRLQIPGPMRHLRQAIAALAALFSGGALALAAGPFNPLFAWGAENTTSLTKGPLILDSLALAYALPGAMLLAAAYKMAWLHRTLRLALLAAGTALVALYTGLEIRRFWQGDYLGAPGVTQGELYSYTIAMMLLGAGLLYQAIAKRSALLRRIAMGVIALTVAKVFLLDASGLTGLTRVFSFLGLGLSLAGLAWLNRWAADATTSRE